MRGGGGMVQKLILQTFLLQRRVLCWCRIRVHLSNYFLGSERVLRVEILFSNAEKGLKVTVGQKNHVQVIGH